MCLLENIYFGTHSFDDIHSAHFMMITIHHYLSICRKDILSVIPVMPKVVELQNFT